MKKKIFVIGSYGAGNVGDEAILETIKNNFHDFDIIPAIPHLPYSIFRIPFRLSVLNKLKKADIVLLGGGGLFTDSDTIEAIKIWGNAINWANFFNKKVFVYANSIGPFYSKKAERLAYNYLSKVDAITVRDKISATNLKRMGLSAEVFSDPVFSYKFSRKGGGVKRILAVSLRSINNETYNYEEFEKYLTAKEKSGYKLLFVFMDEKDFDVYEKYHKKEGRFLVTPKDFTQLIEILERCEMCVGMRLHFLIASALLGKRMMAISYSSKVKGVMDEIGIDSLRPDEKDFSQIEKRVNYPVNIDKQIKKVEELNNGFREFVESL